MVSKGAVNSQIPELSNSDVCFAKSLLSPPKDFMQDRWWREARCVRSPMSLGQDQQRWVHLFPFWEFDQLPLKRPLQKGPALGCGWQLRPLVAIW